MTPFLVVAAGRSGTQYVTRVLQEMDVLVKHEDVFLPHKLVGQTRDTMTALCEREGVRGDVSWFAASYLHLLPNDWPIVHLVRNPVKVIRSWVAHGFWPLGMQWDTVRLVVDALGWSEEMLKDELECSIRYWLGWNRLIFNYCKGRQKVLVVRLEDFSTSPSVVEKVLEHLGYDVPVDVEARLDAIPRDVGASKYMTQEGVYRYSKPLDPSVCWATFSSSVKADILPLAEQCGYALRELEGV